MMNQYQVELPTLNQGLIFRARRVQLGKTLVRLAGQAGVGLSTLRRLELEGVIELRSLRRIAPHLDVSMDQALAMLSLQREQMITGTVRVSKSDLREAEV